MADARSMNVKGVAFNSRLCTHCLTYKYIISHNISHDLVKAPVNNIIGCLYCRAGGFVARGKQWACAHLLTNVERGYLRVKLNTYEENLRTERPVILTP